MIRAVVVLLPLLLAPAGAMAQARAPAPAAPAAPSAPEAAPAPEVDPLYQPRLERLAEVLGALHHLRALCRSDEAQTWRNEMSALIEAEQPPPGRRDRLVAAFNRGFSGPRDAHRSCTPASALAAERYREEAAGLARDLIGRFAN